MQLCDFHTMSQLSSSHPGNFSDPLAPTSPVPGNTVDHRLSKQGALPLVRTTVAESLQVRRTNHENLWKVVVASGYFDPLHYGHIEYLQRSRDLATV